MSYELISYRLARSALAFYLSAMKRGNEPVIIPPLMINYFIFARGDVSSIQTLVIS
jgi:hypothetical protein